MLAFTTNDAAQRDGARSVERSRSEETAHFGSSDGEPIPKARKFTRLPYESKSFLVFCLFLCSPHHQGRGRPNVYSESLVLVTYVALSTQWLATTQTPTRVRPAKRSNGSSWRVDSSASAPSETDAPHASARGKVGVPQDSLAAPREDDTHRGFRRPVTLAVSSRGMARTERRAGPALNSGVFLVAFATLMYEVLLTRIFSVTM